jgi:hypothetical protein
MGLHHTYSHPVVHQPHSQSIRRRSRELADNALRLTERGRKDASFHSGIWGVVQEAVCRSANPTVRIGQIRFSDTEVNGHMTANWAAAVVNVLILAFFAVVAIGVGLGAYAATELKKAEDAKRES